MQWPVKVRNPKIQPREERGCLSSINIDNEYLPTRKNIQDKLAQNSMFCDSRERQLHDEIHNVRVFVCLLTCNSSRHSR